LVKGSPQVSTLTKESGLRTIFKQHAQWVLRLKRFELLRGETPNPESGLYYSMPCAVGQGGIIERHYEATADLEVATGLQKWLLAREKP
jgi:hypothetical protein